MLLGRVILLLRRYLWRREGLLALWLGPLKALRQSALELLLELGQLWQGRLGLGR